MLNIPQRFSWNEDNADADADADADDIKVS